MMKGQQTYMFHLQNSIRTYHWGSADAISRLLGYPAEQTPQAELWLGAHPGSPSRLREGGRGLDELIAADPASTLGDQVNGRYGQLPFLMKVLAADQPLSIQVHPSQAEAREGFARENAAGIAPDDPRRNYKDQNHKPEMLYALTDFLALGGFRDPQQIINDLHLARPLLAAEAQETVDELVAALQSPRGLGAAVEFVLGGQPRVNRLVQGLTEHAPKDAALAGHRHFGELEWIAGFYPGDPGVLVALLMNLVSLAPGEAISLGAGRIHAYLRGVGIEVMANSDNVLRGGLTTKHIDVPELLQIVLAEPGAPQPVPVRELGAGNRLFTPQFEEFQLQLIEHRTGQQPEPQSVHRGGAGIALCTAGSFTIAGDGQDITVQRGDSLFLPASAAQLTATAHPGAPGTLFIASAQLPDSTAQRN